MHILIAPNAFKNSLDAKAAAEAIEKGLQRGQLNCTTTKFPVADGGDGTAELLMMYMNAVQIKMFVKNPLGNPVLSFYGWIENTHTAIIELAAASGLRLLQANEYNARQATTYGTGELIMDAIKKNARQIILCIGGSATTDGGMGILRALGFRFFDKEGNELNTPADLKFLSDYSLPANNNFLNNTEIIILCDVLNPLLGEQGAASVFGPQKGASEKDILKLEEGLTRFRDIVLKKTAKDIAAIKHGGAAGGVAAGLYGLLNATLVSGIDYFLSITDFKNKLKESNLVITGEGSLDRQTLQGKAPFGVAKMAKEFSVPVIGLAGKIPDKNDKELDFYFKKLININEPDTKPEDALKNTYTNLELTSYKLSRLAWE